MISDKMITDVGIDGVQYGLAIDYQNHYELRQSFNRLTDSSFGFNLEDWYQRGFWKENYIPYSLLHQDRVVSNISVNIIAFQIDNKEKLGIQLGTVMTDDNYRNRGLNRFIMELVLTEWKDHCDFIFLFANDQVLNFYPKFNFEKVEEHQYSRKVDPVPAKKAWKKMNMDDQSDIAFVVDMIKNSVPISRISMRDNTSLIMFYFLSFKKNNFYYVEQCNAIVVAEFAGDTLCLDDVFSPDLLDINEVTKTISDAKIIRVVLGFTPLDTSGWDSHIVDGADTLFMLKDQKALPEDQKWMFPVLSHA
ncbi:MAG: GNAT family N-acetyltransferase [Cyclobacteriaceae bacterium]